MKLAQLFVLHFQFNLVYTKFIQSLRQRIGRVYSISVADASAQEHSKRDAPDKTVRTNVYLAAAKLILGIASPRNAKPREIRRVCICAT